MNRIGPLITFGPLDWLIVLLFVALVFFLGFSAKIRNSSVLQFLAAGRRLSLPAFIATLVSTWYGGILGVGEAATFYGLGTWLLLGAPYYLFALAYGVWIAPRVRQEDQLSIPERFHVLWGKKSAVLGAVLIFLLAVPGAHVLMLGTLLRSVTGWPLPSSIMAATLAGTLFLYRGGLLADVRAGFAAFVMMYVGFAILLIYCLLHFPPARAFASIRPPELQTVSGGKSAVVIVSFFLLGAWTIVDPSFHQRVASAATPVIGRKGVLWSILCWLAFDVLSIGVALYALALLRPIPGLDPLDIYPAFAQQVLPPGLKALFFCGMLGTILCAMVGYTLVAGATIGRELIARFKAHPSDAFITNWTRVGMAVSCLAAILLGSSMGSVVNLWYAWGGLVTGCLLLPVVASYLAKPNVFSESSVFNSILISFALTFIWMLWCGYVGNTQYQIHFARNAAGWRVYMGGPSATLLKTIESWTADVGTLVPALVISSLVLGGSLLWKKLNDRPKCE